MKYIILLFFIFTVHTMAQDNILFSNWHDNKVVKLNVMNKEKEVFALDSVETVRDPHIINDTILVANSFFKGKSKCALFDIRTGEVLKILDWLYDLIYKNYIINYHGTWEASIDYYDFAKEKYKEIQFNENNSIKTDVKGNIYLLNRKDGSDNLILWSVDFDKDHLELVDVFDFKHANYNSYFTTGNKYYFYKYNNEREPYSLVFDLNNLKIKNIIKNARPLSWYNKSELFILRDKSDLYLYNIENDTEKFLFSKKGLWDIKFVKDKYIIGYYFWKIDYIMNFAGFVKYDFNTKEINTIYTFEKFKFNTATKWQLY